MLQVGLVVRHLGDDGSCDEVDVADVGSVGDFHVDAVLAVARPTRLDQLSHGLRIGATTVLLDRNACPCPRVDDADCPSQDQITEPELLTDLLTDR